MQIGEQYNEHYLGVRKYVYLIKSEVRERCVSFVWEFGLKLSQEEQWH